MTSMNSNIEELEQWKKEGKGRFTFRVNDYAEYEILLATHKIKEFDVDSTRATLNLIGRYWVTEFDGPYSERLALLPNGTVSECLEAAEYDYNAAWAHGDYAILL